MTNTGRAWFILALLAFNACGNASLKEDTAPRILNGRMTVRAEGPASAGTPCTSDAERIVRIESIDGDILAEPELTPSLWMANPLEPRILTCELTFSAELPNLPEYRIAEGDSAMVVSADRLFEKERYGFFSPAQFYHPESYSNRGPVEQ